MNNRPSSNFDKKLIGAKLRFPPLPPLLITRVDCFDPERGIRTTLSLRRLMDSVRRSRSKDIRGKNEVAPREEGEESVCRFFFIKIAISHD